MMNKLIQSALVFISVLMSATGTEQVVYVKAGESVTLNGPASSYHYVDWYFNDKSQHIAWINPFGGRSPNKDNFSLIGNALVIDNIQQFGTFIYEEKSGNGRLISSKTYKLLQVSVTKTPDSLLMSGDSLTLGCNVAADMKPYIYWLTPREEQRTNPLSIRATSEDNGQWTCVLKNIRNISVSVVVVGLSPAPTHQYTSVNLPLTVPCSLASHLSWKHLKEKGIKYVQWHFTPKISSHGSQEVLFNLSLEDPITLRPVNDNGLHPASDTTKGNLSLTKKQWKEADRGNYTCSMIFNNDVTVSTTVQVEVLQISSYPGTQLIVGQKVNLSCSTGDLLPAGVQLKWIPPEKSSLRISDHHSTHLTIPEVGTDDKGRWRCELWQNNIPLTSATIMLKIEPILSVWMLVIICGAAVIIILLLVLAFILCRRRQRATRHLRHRLCRCKNPKPKGFYRT
ncbi:CD4-1 molecule [Parambassis ranga]|uniref:CD4-1 molecule n=1 Tax=Parambassis ranga TaxID=210632 RepID=A0A6P7JTY0_9TELE|nr:uncharacterized protein LOC114447914 [Parambassis ranga]